MVNPTQVHTVYKKKDGTRVPSVTTYLGILNKPAIVHWAWELGVQGLDYRKVRDQAGDTGSLVHYLILSFLKGLEPELANYSQNEIAATEVPMKKFYAWLKIKVPLETPEAFDKWQREGHFKPILLEVPLVSEIWSYGGTPDFYGKVDGELTLLDFKTGKEVYQEAFCQVAAYEALLQENGYPVKRTKILRIGKSADEEFEERACKSLTNYWKIFLACQQIYELQKQIRRTSKEKK